MNIQNLIKDEENNISNNFKNYLYLLFLFLLVQYKLSFYKQYQRIQQSNFNIQYAIQLFIDSELFIRIIYSQTLQHKYEELLKSMYI
ncbi:hypothetical protein pb186bvf_014019 [Paramecium bursaria]